MPHFERNDRRKSNMKAYIECHYKQYECFILKHNAIVEGGNQ